MNGQEESTSKKIKDTILSGEEGRIYFISDFVDLGNDALVAKVLYRLEKSNLLIRLSKGIYLYPVVTRFGVSYPSLHTIAKAIAERDKVKIMPTGHAALNQLGLSTQVPMNAIYLTSGSARTIQVGKRKITFKRSVPKNFQYKGSLLPLIVFAMKELGEKNIDDSVFRKIEDLLNKSDERESFEHDIALAPAWIRNLLLPIIKKNKI